jgi:predicted DNA-binding transcriptional regulator AlpA
MQNAATIDPELDAPNKDIPYFARFCGMSISKARRIFYTGDGPRHVRVGSQIRFSLRSLHQWIEQQPSGGASSRG